MVFLKRLLRPVYAPPRDALYYLRARRINRAYSAQYAAARAQFASTGRETLSIPSLTEVGVRQLTGTEAEPWVQLPRDWDARVARIAQAADAAFARPSNCMFLPPIDHGAELPERTVDVPAVQRGAVISLQLKAPEALSDLEDLARAILPQVEKHVYGARVIVDKIYVYRNLIAQQREQVSWLWHYDNHPTQVLKLMVYLTPVDAGRAPMEYIRHSESQKALIFAPYPLLGNSRVSHERVNEYFKNGYTVAQVIGPAGTVILFDDNVLHRATLARTAHRDALVFQIRPAAFRPASYIDSRWTGSFVHDDFNQDPTDYAVHQKRRMLSA